jgi:hypothetical protein
MCIIICKLPDFGFDATHPQGRIDMVGGPVRMANVNPSLSEFGTRQFSRLFVVCHGKIYTFILTIYSRLCRSAVMLLNETCTYRVTVPKSIVNVPK